MWQTVRLVQIGEGAGPGLLLFAAALRTSGIQIMGTGSEIVASAANVYEWMAAGEIVAARRLSGQMRKENQRQGNKPTASESRYKPQQIAP